jgi:hypothetical protein
MLPATVVAVSKTERSLDEIRRLLAAIDKIAFQYNLLCLQLTHWRGAPAIRGGDVRPWLRMFERWPSGPRTRRGIKQFITTSVEAAGAGARILGPTATTLKSAET